MMIGPEPMMRMRWRSSRRGITSTPSVVGLLARPFARTLLSLPHELREVLEEVVRIVRAGSGFRMVLHAEDRMVAVAEALQRLIVQIDVGDLDIVEIERIGIH